MTFEQFADIVRDWTIRMTPAQVKLAASSIVQLPIDLPPKISVEAALIMVAELSEPAVAQILRQAAKSAPAPLLDDSTPPAWERATQGERREQTTAGGARSGAMTKQGQAVSTSALQPVAKRARTLVREQLKNGPKPGAQVEAAAQAAKIPKAVLFAATDALGVRTRRGEWRLP